MVFQERLEANSREYQEMIAFVRIKVLETTEVILNLKTR